MLRRLNSNVRHVWVWALILAPFASGCTTKEPVLWSAAHNKRIALTLIDGFSHPTLLNPIPFDQAHGSFDRIFYNIDEYPGEPYMDHWGREAMSYAHGLHRLQLDFERIFFDMPEYPLESDDL